MDACLHAAIDQSFAYFVSQLATECNAFSVGT